MIPNRKVVKDKTSFLVRRENKYVSWATVIVVLGVWEIVGRLGIVPSLFLPRFSAVLVSGYGMVESGEIFTHLAASLWRIGWGFFSGGRRRRFHRCCGGVFSIGG